MSISRLLKGFSVEKRPRNKFVLILLALSLLAFIAIGIVPLIGALVNPPTTGAVTPGAASSGVGVSAEIQRLEQQESGYKTVLEREPDNEAALIGLFETRAQLIQQGKRTPKDLIEPLKTLKQNNPDEKEYALILAQTYQQSEDREQAAKIYRELLAQKPDDGDALQGLVALFISENQAASAVELLENTIKEQSGQPGFDKTRVELLLGDVYTSQSNYDQALTIYDQLLEDNAQDYRPNLGKAITLSVQGKSDEAKSWFKKATDLAPAQVRDQIRQIAKTPISPTPAPNETPAASE